jgi:hypothetical protein
VILEMGGTLARGYEDERFRKELELSAEKAKVDFTLQREQAQVNYLKSKNTSKIAEKYFEYVGLVLLIGVGGIILIRGK